jgi:CRISPR-associated protein Cas1
VVNTEGADLKETIYIFSSGQLKRKENTLFFETAKGDKKFIPVEHTCEILIFGEVDLNKKILEFLSQKEIMLSYFNYYGYYMGTFYPREHYNSGFMTLNQSKAYLDEADRLYLAQKFVEGAARNALKILKYYDRRQKNLSSIIKETEQSLGLIPKQKKINKLMAVEGNIKSLYYKAFNTIINNNDFYFSGRNKRPPKDYINALISFSNVLIYTYVLKDIYQTHLDPRIGFLHSTNFRRFTLNLDVAEIFKPVIGDRTIFSVINKKIISAKDFDKDLKGILLNDKGKQKFLKHLEERMGQTIKYGGLDKKVSYRRLIRLELYKLEKHLMGEKKYKPFVMEW